MSSWNSRFSDFGANLAPTWHPKSTQNRSKSHPNSIPTCILFSIASWIDFRTNLHGFLIPKSTKNQSKFNQKVNKTSQQPKNKKVNNYSAGPMKSCPRPCYVVSKNRQKLYQHASENRSRIDALSCINFTTNLAPFWDGFGSHFGSKLPPNCSKNRLQN